jgi:hypothetical protein
MGRFCVGGPERGRGALGRGRLRPGATVQAAKISDDVWSQGEADLPGNPEEEDGNDSFEERR